MKHSWNRASKRKHRVRQNCSGENSGGRGDTLSRALAGRVSERPINRSVKDDRDHWLLTLHPLSYFSSVYQPTWPVNSGTHTASPLHLFWYRLPINRSILNRRLPFSLWVSGSLGMEEFIVMSRMEEEEEEGFAEYSRAINKTKRLFAG